MDRIAVSGTVDAGSIPAWSANVHTPLPYLGPPRCACAEIVRQGGVLVSVKKADPIGPAFTFRVINRSICL